MRFDIRLAIVPERCSQRFWQEMAALEGVYMAFVEIDPKELQERPFSLFADEWALLTAGSVDDCNTMTVSWGAAGTIWGSPSCTAYVRQTRYTKEFMDSKDTFTLSFFGGECQEALNLCGKMSGRDGDKIAEAGLTPVDFDGTAGFAEARLVLKCAKKFVQFMDPECFEDEAILDRWYSDKNYHSAYIGLIDKAYVRKG